MENKKECPCKTCTRVKDPENCMSKSCVYWRAWFIDKWEAMRKRHATGGATHEKDSN